MYVERATGDCAPSGAENVTLNTFVNRSADASFPPLDEELLHYLESLEDDAVFDAEMFRLEAAYGNRAELCRAKVRRLLKQKELAAALALIDENQQDPAAVRLSGLDRAELLHDAREFERSAAIFEDLLEANPEHLCARLSFARRLVPLGQLVKARNLLLPLVGQFPEGNWRRLLIDRTLGLYDLLTELEGEPLDERQDARIIAMKHAILQFRDRDLRNVPVDRLGRLTLITGSLGPGGAERQLTRLAIELERARRSGASIGGLELDKPVEVLVRSHGPEKQNDFYLSEVQSSGCDLHQINLFKPQSNRSLGVADTVLGQLVDYLPSPVNYGVRRLTPHFRESQTDTASIWQDGACLFGALAALVAGVPHVQLAIRGLPPSMRKHMYRPEYEVLYRALAEVPGVTFVSNSLSAARAYSEWLGIPLARFSIVYNGVEPMRVEPSAHCARLWHDLVARTEDATQTIGGVFRFDTDKQPLLWIRFAARYLKRHPHTRFVLVGGGRLLPNAEQLAEELGISNRILFVGRSTTVGYWMTQMDVLVLLSRFEGLPNVLLEAQYMGVRVVTTPAGGAAECLIDGTTGYVLECPEKPDLEQVVAKVHSLALRTADRDLFQEGGTARDFLDANFSIPKMLQGFVKSASQGLPSRAMHAARLRQVA
jgi:glycosyltransferase involved in cell wall biosynthesis